MKSWLCSHFQFTTAVWYLIFFIACYRLPFYQLNFKLKNKYMIRVILESPYAGDVERNVKWKIRGNFPLISSGFLYFLFKVVGFIRLLITPK